MTPRLDDALRALAEKRRQLIDAEHERDTAAADHKGGESTFEARWVRYEKSSAILNAATVAYHDAVKAVLAAWAEEPRP